MRYKFREWIDPRTNEGVFSERYSSLGAKGQAKCDTRMIYLRDQPPENWQEPHARKLSSQTQEDCKDIYEIRFKANNVQERPLGYFDHEAGDFIIVCWAKHQGKTDAGDSCSKAKERWDAIKRGDANTREIEID